MDFKLDEFLVYAHINKIQIPPGFKFIEVIDVITRAMSFRGNTVLTLGELEDTFMYFDPLNETVHFYSEGKPNQYSDHLATVRRRAESAAMLFNVNSRDWGESLEYYEVLKEIRKFIDGNYGTWSILSTRS